MHDVKGCRSRRDYWGRVRVVRGVVRGTSIFRPGKGKLFDYPNLSDYSIDIKYFFNYNNKQGHILFF